MSIVDELKEILENAPAVVLMTSKVVEELLKEGISEDKLLKDAQLMAAVSFIAGRWYEREQSVKKWTIN